MRLKIPRRYAGPSGYSKMSSCRYLRPYARPGVGVLAGYALACLCVVTLCSPAIQAQSDLDQVHVNADRKVDERAQSMGRNRVFTSSVDLVLVPVTVTDSMGRLVLGLDKKDFQVFDNKEPQSIQHLSSEDSPVSLAVILDTSGSMQGSGKIEKAREAVLEFLETSNPDDEVSLILVADKASLRTDFTTSIETIQNALGYASPRGSTALLDGIYLAISQMRKAKYPRRALLIISDGGDNHSRYSEREVKNLVKESDVLIYSIGIYDRFFPTKEEQLGPVLLADLSEVTGGRVFTLENPNNMVDVAAKISTELRNQYVIGYRPTTLPRDGKWHKIRVKLTTGKRFHQLMINAKKGYLAPSR